MAVDLEAPGHERGNEAGQEAGVLEHAAAEHDPVQIALPRIRSHRSANSRIRVLWNFTLMVETGVPLPISATTPQMIGAGKSEWVRLPRRRSHRRLGLVPRCHLEFHGRLALVVTRDRRPAMAATPSKSRPRLEVSGELMRWAIIACISLTLSHRPPAARAVRPPKLETEASCR